MGTMKNTLVHMANGLHRLEQLLQRMIKKEEQNAQGLYGNRVINEIPVNSQEIFFQDAYDRCVKEV